MTIEELKDKALSLPFAPGVYLMKDKSDRVIYVGKAKKLKNRVSQYFQDTASHSPKTRLMVSKVDHFDVIIASSEFEALVLECSLIKRYLPKYNILLKDDKGYPYIRINRHLPYPRIELAAKMSDDKASYFGPFGSRGVTQSIIKALLEILKLPDCGKDLIRDAGKGRVCLNYHMNLCEGWCQKTVDQRRYRERIEQACELLSGNYKKVTDQIRKEMLQAAEDLDFELAATLRDKLTAVESLGQKQLVTAGNLADTDVIGYGATESKTCFVVLHFKSGNLLDKDYEILPLQENAEAAVSSLMKQYYLSRGYAPATVLLPFEIEDGELFSQLLEQEFGRKTKLKVPQRGDNVRLIEMAVRNAREEAERLTTREDKISGSLKLLGKMLAMEPPRRMESFDISNISGTDMVASMVVFEDGTPKKSDYRKFKIDDLPGQDDYAAMAQVVTRRFRNYLDGEKGFSEKPDLLLIDGGTAHATVALNVLRELSLDIPVFGMVKDDRHRTRALVTPDGMEIRIDAQPAVFSLIGNIQEETHRFAITYHRKLRSNRLRYSELDAIEGIGEKRKQELLRTFKSLRAISMATRSELERVLPKNAAAAVYYHFHPEEQC